MAERRAAENPRPLCSTSPSERMVTDSHLPQSVSAPRQAARNRQRSPSTSPPRQIARSARGGDGPSPQQVAVRPQSSPSVSPPRNTARIGRVTESPSVRGQQTSRSDVAEHWVLLRQQATRNGSTQQHQTARSAKDGESLGLHGTHASLSDPAQQQSGSPSRSRQNQLARGAEVGRSASNQQQTADSVGSEDRSRIRDLQGSRTRDSSDTGLPHRNLVSGIIETPFRSLGSRNRTRQNQGTGSIGGRQGLHLQSLRALPERGTRLDPRMRHHSDIGQMPLPLGDPYTREETISRIANNSGLTEQEQRRAEKHHRYYSGISTYISLGPKTDSNGEATVPVRTSHEFAVNLVSKHNRELPRGWPEMKLDAGSLDDDSRGEAWLLKIRDHNKGPSCESFLKSSCE